MDDPIINSMNSQALNHITVFESGKLVVTFMDGTEIECGGE